MDEPLTVEQSLATELDDMLVLRIDATGRTTLRHNPRVSDKWAADALLDAAAALLAKETHP